MLFYRATVDVSPSTLNYTAEVIRRHCKMIGPVWRLLNPGRQALLVLVRLHKDETFAQLTAGFRILIATAWRYVQEVMRLLSTCSRKLTNGEV